MTTEADQAPAPVARARVTRAALGRSAGFAVLFMVSVWLGRQTVVPGTSLSLVWPAAGVAVVWFAAQRRAGTFWIDVVLLSVVTVLLNRLTGATLTLAACFAVANLAQLLAFHAGFARWCPQLWGAGGTEPLTGVRQFGRILALAGGSTLVGAAIGPTAVWLTTGTYSWLATAVWLTRNTVSVVLVLTVGLRVGHIVTARRERQAGIHDERALPMLVPQGVQRLELVAALAVSVVVYELVFGILDLPIGVLTLPVTVWMALRFDTTIVVLHSLAVGVASVLLTLDHHGPFARIEDYSVRALVVQAFVGVTVIVGLTVALGRDEREVLFARVQRQAEESAAHAERMQALAEVSRALAAATDARGAICAGAREVSGADGAYLLEPDGQGLLVSTAVSGIDLPPITLDIAVKTSMSAQVLRTGESEFVADIALNPQVAASARTELGARSGAWWPVKTHGSRVVGVIGLVYRTRIEALPADAPTLLDALAREAAGAIERADLMRRLSQYSDRDPLTGLANRWKWEETVQQEVVRAQRNGQPLSFVLLDLDHFQAYNDEHGHLAGDELLRAVAGAAKGCLREVDTIARLEGDTFAVAMPGCGSENALAVVERIRGLVPSGQTLTAGIAQWGPGRPVADVLTHADQALYRGKQAGRNTANVHQPNVLLAPLNT